MMPADVQVFRALLRTELCPFVERAFSTLQPAEEFVDAWHVHAVCWHLQQVADGQIHRLLITMPPRHLKSICASVCFPAWVLLQRPGAQIMVASYAQSLAEHHGRAFKTVVESDWYNGLLCGPRFTSLTTTLAETATGGGRLAVTAGGRATGFGADIIIVDDLMKADESHSAADRERVKRVFDETLLSRVNNPTESRVVVVQQRLHEDDLAAHVLDKGTYHHLNLPAIAKADEQVQIGTDEFHRRRAGEALFPQRFALNELAPIRREVGSAVFAAQYLQAPAEGGLEYVKWADFRTYDSVPARTAFAEVVQSWDTAYSLEPTSDYSVCTTWGILDGRAYLLDVMRTRLDYSDLKSRVLGLQHRWAADHVLIESAGSGLSLVQELRRAGHRWVDGRKPRGDKDVRLAVESDKIRRGVVQIPCDAPWLSNFRHELTAFPNSRHDDQVDSLTQFLRWFGQRYERGDSGERRAIERRAITRR